MHARPVLAAVLACVVAGAAFAAGPSHAPGGHPGVASVSVRMPTAWYATGPSNFAACCDIPWPGDAGSGLSANLSPSRPGGTDRGWWNPIKAYIQPAGFAFPRKNNSVGGYTTCNYLSPYCCSDGAAWRIESCPSDDATGDAVCNSHNAGATCEQSGAYYREDATVTPWEADFEGLQTVIAKIATFAPGPNECIRPNTTVAEIIEASRDLIDGFFAFPRVERVYLHMGISWHKRFSSGNAVCANLWDVSCSDGALGGSDCSNTFNDLAAEYGGRVVIQDGPYMQTVGQTSMSGAASLWELYTNDELHENIFGWQLVTLPDMLNAIGAPVTDTPPAAPNPVLDGKTQTTATISLEGPITDPDGDTLTCLLWAHPTSTAWLGGYAGADRVHNGWNVCKQKNGGVPCTNCGDAQADTDCNVAGVYTDADAAHWLTPDDVPVSPAVPDCTSEGVNCMPDLFAIACDGQTPRTIRGLAAGTEYRVLAIAWPTLVPGSTARGILPSEIDDTLTFTTDP